MESSLQVFEKLASTTEIWKDARYGAATANQPHLLFHWQDRCGESGERVGHWSFLTQVPEGSNGTLELPSEVPIWSQPTRMRYGDFLDQDVGVCTGALGTCHVVYVIDR